MIVSPFECCFFFIIGHSAQRVKPKKEVFHVKHFSPKSNLI